MVEKLTRESYPGRSGCPLLEIDTRGDEKEDGECFSYRNNVPLLNGFSMLWKFFEIVLLTAMR